MPRAADPALARSAAADVVRRLRDAGHAAFFAGGCVRDELLGLAPTDYDVATDAVPDRIRSLFPRSDAVGAAFGVVLVHVGAGGGGASGGGGGVTERVTVEVATFRADGPYSDARRPDTVVFSDPRTDALRRDFTVNALFLDPLAGIDEPSPLAHAGAPVRGRVIDYVGGLADLHDRVIRAVGDAEHRLAEDHLRALRAVRFTARLGFALDPATAAAIRRHAAQLRGVSRERIGEEIRRMLAHRSRAVAADLLGALTLDAAIFDEPAPASAPTASTPHPRLHALAQVRPEPVPFELALAAWAADRARAGTDPSGVITALAPTKPQRAAMVAAARRSLCLSNDESDALGNVLAGVEALRTGWLTRPVAQQKRTAARPGFAEALDLVRAEEHAAARDRSETVQEISVGVHDRLRALAATPGGIAPAPLVTGDDLIAGGFTPGPGFKAILDRLYDEQLEGRLTSREQGMELAKGWCV